MRLLFLFPRQLFEAELKQNVNKVQELKDKLTELLEKLAINPQENEFAAVYVNGDHTLTTAWSNADGESGRLKIRQTEAAFLDLMFEGNV